MEQEYFINLIKVEIQLLMVSHGTHMYHKVWVLIYIHIHVANENRPVNKAVRYFIKAKWTSLGNRDSLEVGMVIAWTMATNPSNSI